jgi:hypothetical protein
MTESTVERLTSRLMQELHNHAFREEILDLMEKQLMCDATFASHYNTSAAE